MFTADDARHWALLTRAALAARRAEIDELNVFPVPDGDTGTNLYLTLDGAIEDATAALEADGVRGTADLVRECTTLRRAILMSARGNSGVILSQVVGGLCDVVIERDAEVVDVALLAECLERGAAKARSSVAHPQEGTILTVADAAAAGGRGRRTRAGGWPTSRPPPSPPPRRRSPAPPSLLPVLARAGVVDAGGAGCVLLLESLHRVITGAWSGTDDGLLTAAPPRQRSEWHRERAVGDGDVADASSAATAPDDGGAQGPAFEVMYLLTETSTAAVDTLRTTLDGLGDSLLVVGGPDLWNVHVHVDDAGAAVEAGIVAGRPERVRITHLASQVAAREHVVPIGVVAGAAGPGVATVLEAAGAVPVLFGPGRRASANQLVDAARRTGAPAVVLLPADPDGLMSAEIARACRRRRGARGARRPRSHDGPGAGGARGARPRPHRPREHRRDDRRGRLDPARRRDRRDEGGPDLGRGLPPRRRARHRRRRRRVPRGRPRRLRPGRPRAAPLGRWRARDARRRVRRRR